MIVALVNLAIAIAGLAAAIVAAAWKAVLMIAAATRELADERVARSVEEQRRKTAEVERDQALADVVEMQRREHVLAKGADDGATSAALADGLRPDDVGGLVRRIKEAAGEARAATEGAATGAVRFGEIDTTAVPGRASARPPGVPDGVPGDGTGLRPR